MALDWDTVVLREEDDADENLLGIGNYAMLDIFNSGCEIRPLDVDLIHQALTDDRAGELLAFRSPRGYTLLDCLVCSAPMRGWVGSEAARKYARHMDAVRRVREAGVPCTLTAETMAAAVMGDASSSVVLAAIAAGRGQEIGRANRSMHSMLFTRTTQPNDQSFFNEHFISPILIHEGLPGSSWQGVPELRDDELGLVRKYGATTRYIFSFAVDDLKARVQRHAHELIEQVLVNNRRPSLRELNSIFEAHAADMPDNPQIKKISRFREFQNFAQEKIRWLERWHRSEALWARFLQHTLQSNVKLCDHAQLIVEFLLGSCKCPICVPFHRARGDTDVGHEEGEEERDEDGEDDEDEDLEEEDGSEDATEAGDAQEVADDARDDAGAEHVDMVEHIDSPAQIVPEEAAQIVAQQEAGFVERLVGTAAMADDNEDDEQFVEPIYCAKLNRIPASLRRALSESVPLSQCRKALDAAGHPWMTVEGAFVFVHPHQYRQVISTTNGLRPDNVIFAASLEHLVEETLTDTKAWVRSRSSIAVQLQSFALSVVGSHSEAESAKQFGFLQVKRTFLSLVPQLRTVATQSTSDARLGWVNPRRLA